MKTISMLILLLLIQSCNGSGGGSSSEENDSSQDDRTTLTHYISSLSPNRMAKTGGQVTSTCNDADCIVSGNVAHFIDASNITVGSFSGTLYWDSSIERYVGNVTTENTSYEMAFSNQPVSINNGVNCLKFDNVQTSDTAYITMLSGKTIDSDDNFFDVVVGGVSAADPDCKN